MGDEVRQVFGRGVAQARRFLVDVAFSLRAPGLLSENGNSHLVRNGVEIAVIVPPSGCFRRKHGPRTCHTIDGESLSAKCCFAFADKVTAGLDPLFHNTYLFHHGESVNHHPK
jgi:hypothetical protein